MKIGFYVQNLEIELNPRKLRGYAGAMIGMVYAGATAQTIIGVLKVVLAADAGENRLLNACRRNQIG